MVEARDALVVETELRANPEEESFLSSEVIPLVRSHSLKSSQRLAHWPRIILLLSLKNEIVHVNSV